MKTHTSVTVQVSGGGSGTGIAALLNSGTDICQASRDMKPQEYADAESRKIKPYKVAMALDGVAVFLHEANPVGELTLEQLRGIYTGSITNWKEVGGPAHIIVLYGRENNSGTYAYFKEHVLKNDDYAEATQTLPGTAAVVSAVAQDKYGIGYGGIAWDKGVKVGVQERRENSGGGPIHGDGHQRHLSDFARVVLDFQWCPHRGGEGFHELGTVGGRPEAGGGDRLCPPAEGKGRAKHGQVMRPAAARMMSSRADGHTGTARSRLRNEHGDVYI
jgi:hypothetical protein